MRCRESRHGTINGSRYNALLRSLIGLAPASIKTLYNQYGLSVGKEEKYDVTLTPIYKHLTKYNPDVDLTHIEEECYFYTACVYLPMVYGIQLGGKPTKPVQKMNDDFSKQLRDKFLSKSIATNHLETEKSVTVISESEFTLTLLLGAFEYYFKHVIEGSFMENVKLYTAMPILMRQLDTFDKDTLKNFTQSLANALRHLDFDGDMDIISDGLYFAFQYATPTNWTADISGKKNNIFKTLLKPMKPLRSLSNNKHFTNWSVTDQKRWRPIDINGEKPKSLYYYGELKCALLSAETSITIHHVYDYFNEKYIKTAKEVEDVQRQSTNTAEQHKKAIAAYKKRITNLESSLKSTTAQLQAATKDLVNAKNGKIIEVVDTKEVDALSSKLVKAQTHISSLEKKLVREKLLQEKINELQREIEYLTLQQESLIQEDVLPEFTEEDLTILRNVNAHLLLPNLQSLKGLEELLPNSVCLFLYANEVNSLRLPLHKDIYLFNTKMTSHSMYYKWKSKTQNMSDLRIYCNTINTKSVMQAILSKYKTLNK